MRLLASVLSSFEAAQIINLADLIDVKDPLRGALGAPAVETVRQIKNVIGPAPLSVALGDCRDDESGIIMLGLRMAEAGASIIKMGVTDIEVSLALNIFKKLKRQLPREVQVVAAAYADAEYHRFFSPFDLPAFASDAGADGILIDTCHKAGGKNLFDFLSVANLASIVSKARRLKLMTALAGSLQYDDINDLAAASPDWVGFRSAITSNGNRDEAGVDPGKVLRLKERLNRAGTPRAAPSLS